MRTLWPCGFYILLIPLFFLSPFVHRKGAEVTDIPLRTLRPCGNYHLPSFLFLYRFIAPLRRRGRRDPFTNIADLRLLSLPFIPFSYTVLLHRKGAEVAEIRSRTLLTCGYYYLPSFLFQYRFIAPLRRRGRRDPFTNIADLRLLYPPQSSLFLFPPFCTAKAQRSQRSLCELCGSAVIISSSFLFQYRFLHRKDAEVAEIPLRTLLTCGYYPPLFIPFSYTILLHRKGAEVAEIPSRTLRLCG